MTNSTDTQTVNTKTEVIDRVMHLSQRCEEYAMNLQQKRESLGLDHPVAIAAGDRLVEVRRELRDFLAVSL